MGAEVGVGHRPLARSLSAHSCLHQDYVVLLPSVYYEAALLQLRVTEACTYRPSARRSGEK